MNSFTQLMAHPKPINDEKRSPSTHNRPTENIVNPENTVPMRPKARSHRGDRVLSLTNASALFSTRVGTQVRSPTSKGESERPGPSPDASFFRGCGGVTSALDFVYWLWYWLQSGLHRLSGLLTGCAMCFAFCPMVPTPYGGLIPLLGGPSLCGSIITKKSQVRLAELVPANLWPKAGGIWRSPQRGFAKSLALPGSFFPNERSGQMPGRLPTLLFMTPFCHFLAPCVWSTPSSITFKTSTVPVSATGCSAGSSLRSALGNRNTTHEQPDAVLSCQSYGPYAPCPDIPPHTGEFA